jgi:hypothetical protein
VSSWSFNPWTVAWMTPGLREEWDEVRALMVERWLGGETIAEIALTVGLTGDGIKSRLNGFLHRFYPDAGRPRGWGEDRRRALAQALRRYRTGLAAQSRTPPSRAGSDSHPEK